MAEKIGYLDGLRGLAALIVVIFHIPMVFVKAPEWANLISYWFSGPLAVCVFFVLSGYVLTYRFFVSKDQEVLKSGAIRRYFRLMPPIVFSIIIFLIALFIVTNFYLPYTDNVNDNKIFNHPLDPVTALYQGFFSDYISDNTVYRNHLFNGVLWTMGVEFIGSMIVFAFCALVGTNRNRWIFYLAAILVFADTYYLAFIIGMLLADLIASRRQKVHCFNGVTGNFACLCLFIIGFLLSLDGRSPIDKYFDMIPFLNGAIISEIPVRFYIAGASLMIFSILLSGWLQKLFSMKWALFLGRISFSMYLMHMVVVGIFFGPLYAWLTLRGISTPVVIITSIAVYLAAVLLVSDLTYRYVDEPGTRLSKKIYEWYFAGEKKTVDWKVIEKRVISFTQKNLIAIVALEVILVIGTIGMVVYVKPVVEQNNAIQAVQYYNETLITTVASYDNLTAYPSFNNTSIGAYRVWIEGYETRANNFSANYFYLSEAYTSGQEYFNLTQQESANRDMIVYGDLVNNTQNKTAEYKLAYFEWYWNNTPIKQK